MNYERCLDNIVREKTQENTTKHFAKIRRYGAILLGLSRLPGRNTRDTRVIANVLSSEGTISYKHRRNTHPPQEDVFIFFTRRPDSVAERPLLIVLVKLPASISHVRVRPIMRAFYASPLRCALSIKVRRCRANLWNSLWCVQLLSRAFASVPRVFTIRRCSTIRRVDISRDLRRGTDALVHRSHLPRSKRIC